VEIREELREARLRLRGTLFPLLDPYEEEHG
jgi:hypothetical protein